ncbi:MAG TPA: glycine cleavage system protein H [Verrucomicrobiae bacterium]|jgi:glycine cleavage system H protein|nr:glycine cleavage system protein H [Verrucomicrobiae bacterium]
MEAGETNTLYYKRSHFVTRLPLDRLYSASHYWLLNQNGTWRIGLTKFATRMLGEIVDYGFEIQPGGTIAAGQALGWIEGFKAISDIFSVMIGSFCGSNPELSKQPELIDRDCYGEGWLYEATGDPGDLSMDAKGYKELLDSTIDKLVEKQKASE